MNLKKQIEDCLIKAKFEDAIDLLKQEENLSEFQREQIILLQQEIHKLKKDKSLGVLTYEQVKAEQAKLTLKTIKLTESLDAPSSKKQFSPTEFIEKKVSPKFFLILLALEIIIGFLVELMPDSLKKTIENAFGENYIWIYLIVLGLTLLRSQNVR